MSNHSFLVGPSLRLPIGEVLWSDAAHSYLFNEFEKGDFIEHVHLSTVDFPDDFGRGVILMADPSNSVSLLSDNDPFLWTVFLFL